MLPITVDAHAARIADFHSDAMRRSSQWDAHFGPGNYLSQLMWQGTGSLLSFAAIWLATRVLRASGYGIVVAIIAATQCVQQLFVEWTSVSLFRYGCEEFVKTGRLANSFWARLLFILPSIAIMGATAFLWLPLISRWLHIPHGLRLLILVYLVAGVLNLHVQQTLRAAKLPRLQSFLFALERAVVLSLVAISILAAATSITSISLSYIAGPFVAGGIGLWKVRRLITPRVQADGQLLRRMLWFSLPLMPAAVIGYFSTNYLDAFFIRAFLSSADLAVYSIAYQITGTLMQAPVTASYLLLPFFVSLRVQGRDESITRYLEEVLPITVLAWSVMCALIAFLGVKLLPLVFGSSFASSGKLLWPLMAASAVAGPALMGYSAVSNALSKTYITTTTAILAAAANLLLDAILIPRFGLMGCAWATTAAFSVGVLGWAAFIRLHIGLGTSLALVSTVPAVAGAVAFTRHSENLAIAVAMTCGMILAVLQHRRIMRLVGAMWAERIAC